MANDLVDLARQIGKFAKAENPEAYGDYSDEEIGARLLVQRNGEAHALFQSSNETDAQGNPVVRPGRIEQAWQKAATIGAAPDQIEQMIYRHEAIPVDMLRAAAHGDRTYTTPWREPTMRARTGGEAASDAVRNVYGELARGVGKVSDFTGVTDFAGMADSFDRPDTGQRIGILYPEIPGLSPEDVRGEVLEAAKTLWPQVDAYGKPTPAMSLKVRTKRLEQASGLNPKIKQALLDFSNELGDRGVMPAELHALAGGDEYVPKRVAAKVYSEGVIPPGKKQIVGAPPGVWNAQQERALRENYLKKMELGVAGRDFYDASGQSIMFHANDDPRRANQFGGALAITSPTTSVGANTGFGIKGDIQAMQGEEVAAGRYPTRMGADIAERYAPGADLEKDIGPKRTPFEQNMAVPGGYALITDPKRSVHDIWDMELHGLVNADGSPRRNAPTVTEHRWMDKQQDKIIEEANKRKIGGFTDWGYGNTQAAGWTGQQVAAGTVPPSVIGKNYATYIPESYAQGNRETLYGGSTEHMQEMRKPENRSYAQRFEEANVQHSGAYDKQLRDQFGAAFGNLTGAAVPGPGWWEGEVTPGMHTQIPVGTRAVEGGLPGEREVIPASEKALRGAEAAYALTHGQEAISATKMLPPGSAGARSVWSVTLPGGTITRPQLQQLMADLEGSGVITRNLAGLQSPIVPIATPQGVQLAYLGQPTTSGGQQSFQFMQDLDGRVKEAVKNLGGKVTDAGHFGSIYESSSWRPGEEPEFLGNLRDQVRNAYQGPERFDTIAPQVAANKRVIDQVFAKAMRGKVTMNPLMDRVYGTIADEGWAGLERLAKQYSIPVMVLAAALAGWQEGDPIPQELSGAR